jgi:hypothetical protein
VIRSPSSKRRGESRSQQQPRGVWCEIAHSLAGGDVATSDRAGVDPARADAQGSSSKEDFGMGDNASLLGEEREVLGLLHELREGTRVARRRSVVRRVGVPLAVSIFVKSGSEKTSSRSRCAGVLGVIEAVARSTHYQPAL